MERMLKITPLLAGDLLNSRGWADERYFGKPVALTMILGVCRKGERARRESIDCSRVIRGRSRRDRIWVMINVRKIFAASESTFLYYFASFFFSLYIENDRKDIFKVFISHTLERKKITTKNSFLAPMKVNISFSFSIRRIHNFSNQVIDEQDCVIYRKREKTCLLATKSPRNLDCCSVLDGAKHKPL